MARVKSENTWKFDPQSDVVLSGLSDGSITASTETKDGKPYTINLGTKGNPNRVPVTRYRVKSIQAAAAVLGSEARVLAAANDYISRSYGAQLKEAHKPAEVRFLGLAKQMVKLGVFKTQGEALASLIAQAGQ
jgi:hypothetical protein